ncbi:MAG: T9SS type A sorting domain-containing protein [Bacteroidia bacterium]|nr:T9SS type A sorting domain-containing protein [Bacteroidia bacterium]
MKQIIKQVIIYSLLFFVTTPAFPQWKIKKSFKLEGLNTLDNVTFYKNSLGLVINQEACLVIDISDSAKLIRTGRYAEKVFFINDSTYIITAFGNTFSKSTDYGKTWDFRYKINISGDTLPMTFAVFNYFWSDGHALSVVRGSDTCLDIYLSSNYGDTWEIRPCVFTGDSFTGSIVIGRNSIREFGDSIYAAFGYPSNNQLWKFKNYGNEIEVIDLPVKKNVTAFYGFKSPKEGIVKSFDSFYKTADGFTNLSPIYPTSFGTPAFLFGITYCPPSAANPKGYYVGYNSDFLLINEDDGDGEWEAISDEYFSYIDFKDNTFGVGIINYNEIVYLVENSTSIKEIEGKSTISIYPNPTQSELFVKDIFAGAEYKIFNSLGAEVLSGVYNGNAISVSDLASGIYIIQIIKEREVFQARFVKE